MKTILSLPSLALAALLALTPQPSRAAGIYNTAFGSGSLASETTGDQNAAFGYAALLSNTTGGLNMAIGFAALYSNTAGFANTASGGLALVSNTTGSYNTADGTYALFSNTTGSYGTACGVQSLFSNTTGSYNVADGTYALFANTDGSLNTASGFVALYLNTTGNYNTATGSQALVNNTTGSNNIALGYLAGSALTTGSNNIYIGSPAGGTAESGMIRIGTIGTHTDTFINGNLNVSGDFTASGIKSFKIDHPLDPANKYLLHSCVESPDVKNIYDGNVTTDANGEAIVGLPAYFEALNCDYRYQLTVLGQFAQAMVASKIKGNQFTIKTDKPNVEVSWQVTGVRQDAYIKARPMEVEQDKPTQELGTYLHPELFYQPPGKGGTATLGNSVR